MASPSRKIGTPPPPSPPEWAFWGALFARSKEISYLESIYTGRSQARLHYLNGKQKPLKNAPFRSFGGGFGEFGRCIAAEPELAERRGAPLKSTRPSGPKPILGVGRPTLTLLPIRSVSTLPSPPATQSHSPRPARGTRAASLSYNPPAWPRKYSAQTSADCGRKAGTSSTAPAP